MRRDGMGWDAVGWDAVGWDKGDDNEYLQSFCRLLRRMRVRELRVCVASSETCIARSSKATGPHFFLSREVVAVVLNSTAVVLNGTKTTERKMVFVYDVASGCFGSGLLPAANH